MKKLLKKLWIISVGLLVGAGVISSDADANYTPQEQNHKKQIVSITEETPLYLYHADQLIYDDNTLISWHYSHSSHSSHTSHTSHYSSRY